MKPIKWDNLLTYLTNASETLSGAEVYEAYQKYVTSKLVDEMEESFVNAIKDVDALPEYDLTKENVSDVFDLNDLNDSRALYGLEVMSANRVAELTGKTVELYTATYCNLLDDKFFCQTFKLKK